MGVMRFLIHPPELLENWPELHRAYISTVDGRVHPTRVEVDANIMSCRRSSSESGRLHVAWPVPGFGRPVLSTSCLAERDEPYLLSVELARGKIAQVRDQLGRWEVQGMTIPDDFRALNREAHRLFANATSCQDQIDNSALLANQALIVACSAAEILTRAYTAQRLSVRRRRSASLPALLGSSLELAVPDETRTPLFRDAFTAAVIPVEWRFIEPIEGDYHWEVFDAQVEWCQLNKILPLGGPLLDLSPQGLPEWLWQWEKDILNLQSFVCDYVETAIARYLGRIRHWEVCARVNTGGALALSEENRLLLVARALEVARQADEEIQLTIRVDQPWGDYQARGQHRLSPHQFVDALIRSGIGLSGVNLELSVGYRPRGSGSRDLLETSRLIDQWAELGVPLFVTLAFPSDASADALAHRDIEVDSPNWKHGWSEQTQAEWIDSHLPLLMAKQSVNGIFWSHFSDDVPHYFPNAGLLNSAGAPKPALEKFAANRRVYWQGDSDTHIL